MRKSVPGKSLWNINKNMLHVWQWWRCPPNPDKQFYLRSVWDSFFGIMSAKQNFPEIKFSLNKLICAFSITSAILFHEKTTFVFVFQSRSLSSCKTHTSKRLKQSVINPFFLSNIQRKNRLCWPSHLNKYTNAAHELGDSKICTINVIFQSSIASYVWKHSEISNIGKGKQIRFVY